MSEQIAQEGRGIKPPRPLLVCTRFLQGLSVFSADFTSSVISVLDGDTIEVLHTQHPERICLSGIDCPEKWINTSISECPALRFAPSPPTLGLPARSLCPSRFAPTYSSST